MKRLLPLLLIGTLCGTLPAAGQNTQDAQTMALVARDDTAATFVNTPVEIHVLANDEESNPNLTFCLIDITEPPSNGTADIDRNQTPGQGGCSDDFVTYTPNAGFIGEDSFVYEIQSSGGETEEATVVVFVGNAPVARPDTFQVAPNQTTRLDVLANDSDPDAGDAIFLEEVVIAPEHGTTTVITTGSGFQAIDYNPAANFTGADSLFYAIRDVGGLRDSAWAFITANTLPVARNDSTLTLPGVPVTVDVLANDTDPDVLNDTLTLDAITDAPSNGTATIVNGQIRYTPSANFVGMDQLTYQIRDALGGTDTADLVITVNGRPVAVNDSVRTLVDMPVDVDVLANDSDPDEGPLAIDAIVTTPRHGTATLASGQIRYAPDEGFAGADSLQYTIRDDIGSTDSAWVLIEVAAEAMLQFIHNGIDAGEIDLYLNDERLADDLDFREATPYLTVDAGDVVIDLTGGTSDGNVNPVLSFEATLEPNTAYIALVNGVYNENLEIILLEDTRPQASDPSRTEVFAIHGVPDAGQLDVRVLDPSTNQTDFLLGDNLDYREATAYVRIDPAFQNISITSFDGSTIYDVFRLDFGGRAGEAYTLVVSGRLSGDPALALLAVGDAGGVTTGAVVTATEEETELPKEIALDGNFPNPFNPSTTIQFDLPETAQVSIEVVDMLGRRVLTLPKQVVEAGSNRTLQVDASSLASGTYLYRLVIETSAKTDMRTGRMTLVK